jgi:hypothetical protein
MIIAGVRPGGRATFVSAKVAKTIGPRRGPGDALRCSPNPAARKLASLRQCPPELLDSAPRLGHAEWANPNKAIRS